MKGDFTRFTHDPAKHYRGVLKQQGRVDVDADWNEYVQIQDYLGRTQTRDVIGCCGVPDRVPDGFKIERAAGDHTRLAVRPGRIYVQGLLCELEETQTLVNPAFSGGASPVYLVSIDAWQRHITAVEDGTLPEIALGGVDTTTRVKTEWQIRFTDVSAVVDAGNLDCGPFSCGAHPWKPGEAVGTGMLAARAEEPEETKNLCAAEAQGGYRGLENRLYRVEIHTGGQAGAATFVWSRDNGAVVFPIQKIEKHTGKSTITVKQLGKDEILTLHVGDWVEVLGDEEELAGRPGSLAQVAPETDGTDLAKGIVVVNADLGAYIDKARVKIRRWDHKATGETSIHSDGAILVTEGAYVPLEMGVEVCFQNGGNYQTGDYWLIPARTRVRDVLWPKDGGNARFQERHGIEHSCCALALVAWKNGAWDYPHDCRRLFPPLTDITSGGCCVTVNEGESIQQAVDSVIAAGGGCVCICGGVYPMDGPLVIRGGRNVSLYGVNDATVLHFTGTDKDGEGGILLWGCENVSLADLGILGEDVPALVSTRAGADARPTRSITLHNLTLINDTVSPAGKENGGDADTGAVACAVRLGHARGVTIENCRMAADVGIVSLFGDRLPAWTRPGVEAPTPSHREDRREAAKASDMSSAFHGAGAVGETTDIGITRPTGTASAGPSAAAAAPDYGIGVCDLRMENVAVLYRTCGIWALKAAGWRLAACSLNALPAAGKLRRAAGRQEISYRTLRERLDEALAGSRSTARGTAIKAWLWQDCTVTGCTLSGKIGMFVGAWLGGQVSDSGLTSADGLAAFWLHNADVRGNLFSCSGGSAIAVAGTCRTRIRENTVRGAGRALENTGLGPWLDGLPAYLGEIVRYYGAAAAAPAGEAARDEERPPWLALWMLTEESCRVLGLTALRDAVQELLDMEGRFRNIPVLLLITAFLTPRLVRLLARARLKNLTLPVIALRTERNDLEAAEAGILLRSIVTVGGMRIGENRIHAQSGQGIVVKAHKAAVNPHILIILWRYLLRYLALVFPAVADKLATGNLSDGQKEVSGKILQAAADIAIRWATLSESLLEADYRIGNNGIRSRRTAVEANIFELAVQNNHITLEESHVSNDEIADIVEMLEHYSATKDLATGMRQGSKEKMAVSGKSIGGGSGGVSPDYRRQVGEISCRIGTMSADDRLKRAAQALNAAAEAADAAKIEESLNGVVEVLQSCVDTCGIWIKGAGCRIVGNQVIVPMDARPLTWAQGGVRFWDDEGTPVWLFAYAQLLVEILRPGVEIPSLLSVTETLIDNNEIIRGTGYGIEIGGIRNMPGGMGLADLTIRGNQISDMAGAGIMFHEESMTIAADIGDNRIMDCGSIAQRDVFADERGGIVLRNAVSCRLHNNRIRCSSNLAQNAGLFAVDLRTIYGLTFTDNHLQHNESSGFKPGSTATGEKVNIEARFAGSFILAGLCGAVRLAEMNGEVGIHDNDILMLRGIGSGLLLGYENAGSAWGEYVKAEAVKYLHKKFALQEEAVATGAAGAATESVAAAGQAPVATASIQGNHFTSLANDSFLAFVLADIRELNFSGNNVRTTAPGAAPGTMQNIARGVIAHNMLDTLHISGMGAGTIVGNCSSQAIAVPAGVTAGYNVP